MKKHTSQILALLLAVVLCLGLIVPAGAADRSTQDLKFEQVDGMAPSKLSPSQLDAADEEQTDYAADDIVRVSIVLKDASTIEKFGSAKLSSSAVAYRNSLKSEQKSITQRINAKLDGSLDVVWNLTLAANIISANVRYDQIEKIESVRGVESVLIENRYEPMVVDQAETNDPNMATSSAQIGSGTAWAAGYTGVGSKIAIIDTGLDTEQQSFSAAGYEYSLTQNLKDGETLAEYEARVGILTKDGLTEDVLKSLNVKVSADKVYLNSKIPFAYNYIDKNYTVNHMSDQQGEHGSHVAGIAAANAYIQQDDGTFASALESVKVQGVAPDAQLVVMKVFGAGGGAYDSDYMAAIEDAIVLGCDSVNLSLGSGNPGFSRVDKDYAEIMDNIAKSGTVVSMSAGNSGYWAENSQTKYLYADDVSMQADGSPGSFTNSLAVASVNNDGFTGSYFTVGGRLVGYTETSYKNAAFATLKGEQEYVILPASVAGNASDFEGIDVTGKVVFVQRGSIAFTDKAANAVNAGAIATVVYNNASGTINMDLSSYTKTAPCVSITEADGLAIWEASAKSEDGKYATGTMTVADGVGSVDYGSDYYTMSDFSSWGVPGSLELKPEITAPGGSIYSVNGAHKGDGAHTSHDAYETMSGTSMASPQVAGMAAVVAQYIRENGLAAKTGLTVRQLTNSLLMSTAEPVIEEATGLPYSVLNQGAGLANVGSAVTADSYVLVKDNLSGTASDGKVKAEFGDDPERTGAYSFGFSLNNLTDAAENYTFSAELFTQDIFEDVYNEAGDTADFLDTWTAPLAAGVTYTVDGKTFVPTAAVEADVNGDGVTDAQDAQCILDHVTGVHEESCTACNLTVADLNGDGAVTSYDAQLLLKGMTAASVVVPAGGKVNVTVSIRLTETQKAQLDAAYPNGAYVEGYVYAEPANTQDGAILPTHSIPLLGFYGNWSDASMLDTATTVEQLYGDDRPTYLGLSSYTNYNTVKYPGEKNETIYTVNPYVVEDEIPYDRAAINSASTLAKYYMSVIRNAAAAVYFVKDAATGEIVYMGGIAEQLSGAYYYTNGDRWENTAASLTANQKVSSLGFKEGDKFTAGVVLIPEYYEQGDTLTEEQISELITSGKLGKGAYFTNTYTVDNTAPEAVRIYKDLQTGEVTVLAQDNQYVAFVGIYNASGKKLFTNADGIQMAGTPEQTKAGELCALTFPLDDTAGEYITVTVADYAGNEVSYKVKYGGTPEDFTGRMIGYTSSTGRGNGQRWVEIDPATLSSTDGMIDFAAVNYEVYAADYAGKYVFFATADGIYAAPIDDLENAQKLTAFTGFDADEMVVDMAFNTQDKTMYLLSSHIADVNRGSLANNGEAVNKLYSMDLVTGQLTKIADITTGGAAAWDVLRTLAVDANGNFYAVNNASSALLRLYTWTLSDIQDGALALTGTSLTSDGAWVYSYASLTYDQTSGKLYLTGSYGPKSGTDADNVLWVLDPEAKTLTHVNETDSRLTDHVIGLFVVPANTITLPTDADITGVEMTPAEITLLKGTTYQLEASVYPWLAADKSVTWSSSDSETVSVDESGTIKTLKVGTATITAASVADPTKTASCTVTVEALPEIQASALVYDTDSKTYWSDFSTNAPESWTKASEEAAGAYMAGALHEGELLLHDGKTMYGVDPDTFEVTSYGEIASSWIWSDAAACPVVDGSFGRMIALCNNGTFLEMIDPVAGKLSYFDLSESEYAANDPMAAIAYIESGTYVESYLDTSTWQFVDIECPANFYYVMMESGMLYKFAVYDLEGNSKLNVEWVGNTGLELPDVSSVTGGKYASMIYDQETRYLLVASYQDGDTATLYAIDPTNPIPAEVGTFGDKVWPVVSLYQYERPTDLTIKTSTSAVELYAGDSVTVSARAILGETNELTWTSANESIATVKDGVITGVAEGETTVTITTVDTNKAGEHVTKDIAVTVKPTVSLNATVNAQVTTEEGTAWVGIDLSSMGTTKLADASTQFYGGGYAAGYLWGTDIYDAAGNMYRVDPSDGFKESQGSGCSTSYCVRDLTDNPAVTFKLTVSEDEVHTATTFGDPIYLSGTDGLYELVDYVEGNISGWRASSSYPDLAAIAYIGQVTAEVVNTMLPASSQITECDADTLCNVYYVLGVDGTLYQFITVPIWDVTADEGEEVGAILVRGSLGSIGQSFEDVMALSMEYVEVSDSSYGLLIADADTASIYYADLAGDGIVTAKVGNLSGADYISSLYGVSVPGASDDSDASEQIRHVMALAESANASQDVGDALTASGVVSLRTELTETEVTGETAQLDVVQKGDELANVSTGSLNAVQPQSVTPSTVEDGRSIVTVTIADDVAVTNGKYTVTYDPSKLTFRGLSSAAQVKSYLADEEKGIVTFAFASEEAVAAGNTLATLTFTYSGCDVTSVTVAASERNDGAASDSKVSTILYGTSPSTPAGPTEPEFPFKDVTTDHPFYEDIQYVYEKGLMQGVSEDIFQSGATTTRGMIATILYRMEGEPAVSGSNPFPDVADGSYCDDATIWAAGCGVVKGYADGTFRPDQTISREQMAAILYRYAQYKGCDVSVGEDTNLLSYTDAAQVAEYAIPAFQWAVGAGIINGTTATTLSPKGSATRGQVAAILHRYCEWIG